MSEPVVLITGAARRIGAQIARTLHRAGYRIVVHYRQSANDALALTEIFNAARPGSAVCLKATLNHTDEVNKLAEQALSAWGRMDVLINNASSFYPTPIMQATEQQWDDLMASNLKAPFFLARALTGELKKRNGSIVNIADIHARRPLAGYSIYSIAKAGNAMLTKSLALELAPEVKVNGIAPGAILWPEDESGAERRDENTLSQVPLQALGGAESIARTVEFLLTDNTYITGHIIPVDGGRTLRQ